MTPHAHDGGLAADLPRLLSRRRALGLAGGLGVLLAGCGNERSAAGTAPAAPALDQVSTEAPATGRPAVAAKVPTEEIPAETAGPFPGNGTNGPDALGASGVVRKDIRPSFGDASGTAEGVPLTVRLTVLQLEDGVSEPIEGAAVYLWHCDREGRYSMYEEPVIDENYLRGVQAADARGVVEFTTIFPGAYTGRWPHMHFEVYPDAETATAAGRKLRTTQLALPQDACDAVYATAGYERSVQNMKRLSLESDGVFADGYSLQLAKVTGSVQEGFVATLTVPV